MVERRHFVKDGLHATGLGVGEEHLSKAVAADERYKALDAKKVKFVENIVEQKDWFLPSMVHDILELSQFKRQCETLLLSL